MPRITQSPPPGVVRRATPEATQGTWFDMNNMRWRGQVLQPIGGNAILPASVVPGTPRDLITWFDNQHQRYAAFGTDDKLYIYNFNAQSITDITPTGVGPLSPAGAYVGYGLNTYGTGIYGGPRNALGAPPGILGNLGDWWSMDTWGEDLMVVPTQDGGLYRWSPLTPTAIAAPVTGAPTQNRGVMVSDQRSVVLYGAGGDPRAVAWSDQEDPNTWTPNVSNAAGSLELVTQGVALTAVKTPSGILIFTTTDVHMLSYVGSPYFYGLTAIGAGCGPISSRAPVSVGSFAAWPSWQNFWMFSGNVQPMDSPIKDWFFATINQGFGGWLFGSPNLQFTEVWWDFPDEGSTVCNRYTAVNYASQGRPWIIGQRQRTAADRNGTLVFPIVGGVTSGGQGALFQEEYGELNNGNPRASTGTVYAET